MSAMTWGIWAFVALEVLQKAQQIRPNLLVIILTGHGTEKDEERAKQLGGDQYRLASRMTIVTPKCVWDAVLTGKPYPLKAGYLVGTNPVISRANAKEVYKALKKLDFLAVSDFFLTPTAELADIFLPAGTWLERAGVGALIDESAEDWRAGNARVEPLLDRVDRLAASLLGGSMPLLALLVLLVGEPGGYHEREVEAQ